MAEREGVLIQAAKSKDTKLPVLSFFSSFSYLTRLLCQKLTPFYESRKNKGRRGMGNKPLSADLTLARSPTAFRVDFCLREFMPI